MEVPSISEVLSMELSTELSEDQLELLHSGLDGLNQQTVDGADSTQLRELLLRAQYVMRYKHAQLAVAMEEIEKLGEATGENEQLKKRNADLQHLVNTIKSKGTDSGSASVRSELEDLQASRAQLKKDLKTKQRQLDDEKRENDKLSARVEELESERRELRRQLDQLNSTLEGMRPDYDSRSDPEDAGENQYAELLRQKNHYINVLLDDVEAHEREKSELRDQVTSLREQLSEATSQIETMTAEFDQLRRKPRPAEHESAAAVGAGDPPTDRAVQRLQAEVAELRALKTRRDAQFDQLAAVVEERTDQFKRLIAQRHAEIEELQSQLRRASNRAADQTRLAELERLCADQRRQLAARQVELQRATADMEAIAARLETERRAGAADTDTGGGDAAAVVPGDSLLKVRSELSRSEAQVRQLTDRLERTEQQAAEYNDQVTQLTARLREVMEGEFGLSEAVAEIKEAQRQVGVRDRQVTEQNNFINLMQRHLTEVVDENSALRSRLGMEPHEAAELVAAGSGGREKLVHVLEREVQKLEEERIALKLENRKLSRQLRSESQSGLSPEEIRDICRQRKQFWEYVRRLGPASVPAERRPRPAAELLQRITQLESQLSESRERLAQAESAGAQAAAENHQLRTGLREVLESVRQQDAVSSVKVAAPTLEALLQALDTRSLAGGEYRPALVPYSALQQLEGRNEELRDQLRAARAESRSWSVVPAASGGSGTGGVAEALAPAGLRLPAHLSVSSSQLVGQLTAQLTVALKAVDDAGRESQQTRSELEQLRAQLLVCRHQLGLLHERRAADAETWRQERGELVTARQEAETETEALQAQVEQLQLQRPAADTERQLALTVAQLVRAERRLRLTAADRDQLEQRLTAARSELQRAQRAATDTVAELRAGKRTLELQLAALQRQLARSVPLDKLTELNEQVDQLTDKYTTFLQNQEKLLGEERASRLLESELALLRQRLAGLGPTGSQQQAADTDQAQLGEQLPSEERRQRLRAEHAERLQQLLKDQLSEAERRAAELERTYTELADAGGTGRRALEQLCRRLSESAAAGAGPAEPSEAQLQAKLASVEAERDRLRETEQLATAQLEQLRSQQQAADRAADSVRRQLAELQETDDLRGVIASLHQRLLEKERSEAELQCRLDQGRSELEAVRARLYAAETEAGAARRQRDALRAEQGRRMSCVRLAVQELRGCLSLPQRALQERLSETLADLLSRRRSLQLQLSAAQEARDAAEGERQGCKAQRALLESALQQLKSGAPQLQEWLTRCQAAELELATLRPRCERLSAECALVRTQLDEQERRAADAESAVCRLTNRLELRQLEIQLGSVADGDAAADSAPLPATETAGDSGPARPAPRTGSQPSRLPVRRPPPVAVRKSAGDGAADSTAPREAGGDRPAEDNQLTSACEQHAEALRGALSWLAGRRDVCELQSRLSEALQPVAAAAALLIVSADTLRMVCGLPAPGRPPSPAGTYSIPSPPAVDELPPVAGEVPSPSDEVPPSGAADGDRATLPSAAGSLRRLRLAEASVASLQQRLRQKEQSCNQFRRLLDETRQQAARQAEQYSQQLERSSQQLRQQLALVASLEAERSAQRPLSDSGGAEPAQLSRLNESAELVAEQERAIGALMERLRQSRQQEAACRERVARLESERRETAQLLQRTVSSLNEERSQLRAQLEQQRQQAAQAAEARQHAQTKLVSRLREILLRKEQQHHALARVLKDVKAELVQTVEEAAGLDQQQLKGGPPTAGSSGRADTDGGLPALLASAQQQLDDTKSELNERTLRCHKLQAELHEADRRRRDECGRLQRQLETLKGRLEQPARSARAPGDPAKIQEELAKWDERKKWQRCTERLKARLREKEAESERHQLAAAGLKDTIHRLERERAVYETKIRTLTALVSEERYVALERDNQQLKEQLAQLRGSERADAGAELEQLRQRVNMLNGRLAAQRAAARQGKNAAANLARFQKQLAELTARNEELERENGELKAELAELRHAAEESSAPPADGGGSTDRPAERDSAGPATDAGTVSILRRLVERLRADNLRLRRQLLRHTVTSTTEEQVELMRSELNCVVAERDRLAAQLQRLTAS